ncbi:MAG: ankyrin repeat domain-containing protein [Gammaproteobacteria bacterium]
MKRSEIKSRVEQNAVEYGNKSANLMVMSEMLKGISVPDILPLSHEICMSHLNMHNSEWESIWREFKSKQGEEKGGLAEGTHEILARLRVSIEETFKNHPFQDENIQSYLENNFGPGEVLMVRSTGKEDSAELANPGGNESYAGIAPNMEAISIASGKVIASYFSEKSLEQRLKAKGVESDSIKAEPFMPVLLQKMIGETIKADGHLTTKIVHSGVMYVDQNGKVTIQEAPGHGELVVNSKGPINTYFILAEEGTVHQQIKEKPFRMVPFIDENGTSKLIVQKNTREVNQSRLPKEVIDRLSQMGKQIQSFYGDDRDVEFVYDPSINKLYIVQARPIPQGDSARYTPRAISPERIKEVKEKAVYFKAKTIAPAAQRAIVVENADEVIICNAIGDALTKYLDMTQPKIKAVIVARDAPSTSHEAAEFNSVNIPVLFVDKAQQAQISTALAVGSKHIILDPQRGLIVDWADQEDVEAILQDGLFKSSISLERTLLPPSEISFSEENIRKAELLVKGSGEALSLRYHQVFGGLEIIEGTTKGTVAQSRAALGAILRKMIDMSKPQKGDTALDREIKANIVKHAVAYSLELASLLEKIDQGSDPISKTHQVRLLDYVNGLEALISNPGRSGAYSASLYQVLQDASFRETFEKKWPIYKKLAEVERDVVESLSKFGDNAANTKLREDWERFVVQCAVHDLGLNESNLSQLASIIYYLQANDLGGIFVNNIFSQIDFSERLAKEGSNAFSNTIQAFSSKIEELKPYMSKIFDMEVKAAEMEAKAVLWGKKKNHGKLIAEYEKDIDLVIKTITELEPLVDLPILVKSKIFSEISKITEIVDGCIKSMKGSPDYIDSEKRDQAKLFYRMLKPYHKLMTRMVLNIKDDGDVDKFGIMKRDVYLEEVKHKFQKYDNLLEIHESQLSTSGSFAVSSAIVGTKALFERQFVQKKLHLEDFFTFFHQNIISSLSLIAPELSLPISAYSDELMIFSKSLNDNEFEYTASSKVVNGCVDIEYNIPLRNHAAKIYLEYDPRTNRLKLNSELYGHNDLRRMSKICQVYNKFPSSLDLKVQLTDEAIYSEDKFYLSKSFELQMGEGAETEIVDSVLKLIYATHWMTGSGTKEIGTAWPLTYFTNISIDKRVNAFIEYLDIMYSNSIEMDRMARDIFKFYFNKGNVEEFVYFYDKIALHCDSFQKVLVESFPSALVGEVADIKLLNWYVREKGLSEALEMMFNIKNEHGVISLINDSNPTLTLRGGISPLILAMKKNWLNVAMQLIDMSKGINIADQNGNTPLLIALKKGNSDLTLALLNKNADVNLANKKGNTPLLIAVRDKQSDLVLALINRGARIEIEDKDGNTPLLLCASRGVSKELVVLLNHRANVNAINNQGKSALSIAADNQQYDVCCMLIEEGANVNVQDNQGHTPLHIAASRGSLDLCAILIKEGAHIDVRDNQGNTALMHAVNYENVELCNMLIKRGAEIEAKNGDGDTPFLQALRRNNLKVCGMLIELGANINIQGNRNDSALMIAFRQNNFDFCIHLIEKGADVNVIQGGASILKRATARGELKLCIKLIEKGADIQGIKFPEKWMKDEKFVKAIQNIQLKKSDGLIVFSGRSSITEEKLSQIELEDSKPSSSSKKPTR